MKRFIGKKVYVKAGLEGMLYKGVVTSVDEEFMCLDNSIYIVVKNIISVELR